MKYFYGCLIVFLLLLGCKVPNKTVKQQPDPNFHLYLLVGQSNMAGRGVPEELDTTAVPNLLVFAKDKTWQPAREPLHWDKPGAGTGPGFSFGREMINNTGKKIRIGLIPAAHGGSSITSWVKGGYHDQTKGYPYDEAIERAKAAMKAGILKGIIWHQGETDSTPEAEPLHLTRLKDLINRFRTELGTPDLPFVAGELGYFKDAYKSMNQILNQLPAQAPFTAVVSAEGLTDKGDATHFDSASARELGKRYAQAMESLQKNTTAR